MHREFKDAVQRLRKLVIENGEITGITFQKAKRDNTFLTLKLPDTPDMYKVTVKLKPTNQSDIAVELWLPLVWNGRFCGTGNGGAAGEITPLALMAGVNQGYATANTDLGSSKDPKKMYGKPERLVDFGHRATHLMTIVSKQIIEVFYGRKAEYSYFIGGSTGGQQAMREAQDYPEDYDGIVVSAPAKNRTRLHLWFAYVLRCLHLNSATISVEEAVAVLKRQVAEYGEATGAAPADLFLPYPHLIQIDPSIFDDDTMEKPLTENQKALISDLLKMPEGPDHKPLLASSAQGGLVQVAGFNNKQALDQYRSVALFPMQWVFGKDFSPVEVDFTSVCREFIEDYRNILDANSTDLSAFKARGGKMMMIHGTADGMVPYCDSMEYYLEVAAKEGGVDQTANYFRYFLVPGFGHTFGGPGFQTIGGGGLGADLQDREHDFMVAISDWVEKGIAPERLMAIGYENGNLGAKPVSERPVFPYPMLTRYAQGDTNVADSYEPWLDPTYVSK